MLNTMVFDRIFFLASISQSQYNNCGEISVYIKKFFCIVYDISVIILCFVWNFFGESEKKEERKK